MGVVQEELTSKIYRYDLILDAEIEKVINGVDLTLDNKVRLLHNTVLSDLGAFYHKTHFPANMRFVIVSNISSKRKMLDKILGKLNFGDKNKERLPRFKTPLNRINQAITVVKPAFKKLKFSLMFIRPERLTFAEKACLQIISQILTEGHLASRIQSQARSQGLSYGVHSRSVNQPDYASFTIFGDVEIQNSPKLFKIIANELKAVLDDQISKREFKTAQRFLIGKHYRLEVTSYDLLNHYSKSYAISEQIVSYYGVTRFLPKVTREQALETCKGLFLSGYWYLGILGEKAEKHQDQLYRVIADVFSATNYGKKSKLRDLADGMRYKPQFLN